MNYKYNELDYAKQIYVNGFQESGYMPTQLRLVAIYMRRYLDYKPKKLKEELYLWCSLHIQGYSPALHYKAVNKAFNQAVKKGSVLISLKSVPIYKEELDYIDQCPISQEEYSYPCRKLLFALLVQTKANQIIAAQREPEKGEQKPGMFFKGGQRKYNLLKKSANLSAGLKINEELIHALYLSGLVTPLYGGMIRLDFLKGIPDLNINRETPLIQVEDMENIGWYYDYYHKAPRMALCSFCQKPFRKRNNKQIYCSPECQSASNRILSRERMKRLRKQAV